MKDSFLTKLNSCYHTYRESNEHKQLKSRLIENEKWFRKKQDELRTKANSSSNRRIPAVKGGYLFNAIICKHADAMDNYPDISILPREEKDKDLADTLTSVIPYILERNNFEKVYSDNWYAKLKTSACYGVSWNQDANDGRGEICIAKVDLLNLYWQPNINDLEESEFIFYHTFVSKNNFKALYGEKKLEGVEFINTVDTYERESYDLKDDFVLVIDAYYKKRNGNKTVIHTAKFSGMQLLFCSEDEKRDDGTKMYPNGYYEHGRYPFVMDVMYPAEQSIAGFGIVDTIKDTQSYIDANEELLQINNRIVGRSRYLISKSAGINLNDLSDMDKEFVEVTGSINDNIIKRLPVEALPAQIINCLELKKEELKETVGNRDFQQGGTTGGVTSGHALSLLHAVGDKLIRDVIKSSYRSYKEIVLMIIELIRQFYNEERTVRITGKDGNDEFIKFSNAKMKAAESFVPNNTFGADVSVPGYMGLDASNPFGANTNLSAPFDAGIGENAPVGIDIPIFGMENQSKKEFDVPLFDVKLAVQKSNPYSRELNNQTILQLAGMGLLNPANFPANRPVLDALQFEGKAELIRNLSKLYEEMSAPAPASETNPTDLSALINSHDELVDVSELINV